jgi:hypothetical protein
MVVVSGEAYVVYGNSRIPPPIVATLGERTIVWGAGRPSSPTARASRGIAFCTETVTLERRAPTLHSEFEGRILRLVVVDCHRKRGMSSPRKQHKD